MKRAATVLIVKDDKILAVSRKDNENDFGLPGGHVEPKESDKKAAARELKEETGLRAYGLKKVYSGSDGHGFTVITFVPKKYYGKIKTKESGKVEWVEPSILLSGSFKKYNKELFDKVGIKEKETK